MISMPPPLRSVSRPHSNHGLVTLHVRKERKVLSLSLSHLGDAITFARLGRTFSCVCKICISEDSHSHHGMDTTFLGGAKASPACC